jgi:hypothetical protein
LTRFRCSTRLDTQVLDGGQDNVEAEINEVNTGNRDGGFADQDDAFVQ